MLGFLFGLNMRLRRLQFFLSMLGFGIFSAILLFALAGRLPTNGQLRGDIAFALNNGQVIVAIIGLTVISLQLQCMRIRDIGWDPVCVLPGWFAVMIFDRLAASQFPAMALSHEHTGTIVGALVNLGLGLALMFWPSRNAEGETPASGESWQVFDASRNRGAPSTDRVSRVFNGRAN